MSSYDGVVIGSGHNGLTTAAYLAKAGLKIAVIERNSKVGGGCSTEKVTLEGFKHNLHSNFHSFTAGPMYDDLRLATYGLRYLYPEVSSGFAFRDGRAVTLHRDRLATYRSLRRISKVDAERFLELAEKFAVRLRPLINQLAYSRPLSRDELASRIRGPLGEELTSYDAISLYEAIDRNFESEQARVVFKGLAHSRALMDGPNSGSSFPRVIAGLASTALPVGGATALTDALSRVVSTNGGVLITGSHVERIQMSGGRATGAIMSDGETIGAAKFVVSNVDMSQTMAMVGEEAFGAALANKVRDIRWANHSLVTLHVAINEPPDYVASRFDPDLGRALNIFMGADTTAEIAADFNAINRGELPERLYGNGACNSQLDPTYAPRGKHVAFWWPFAPYHLKDGGAEKWDQRRSEFAQRALREWRDYAPNMHEDNVLATYVFTPLDIARSCINMVVGSHHGPASIPAQTGINRPFFELGQYRTPVMGLYLSGFSSHPGGAITGGPGYNCANAISEDLDIERWWTPVAPDWKELSPAYRS